MIYIGIDPGQKGGVVAISGGNILLAEVTPLAGNEVDAGSILGMLRGVLTPGCGNVMAILEKVHSMPKQGVASTFKFGRNYGKVEGALAALHIPIQQVTPQAWKKLVLAGTPKDKAAAISHVRERWPTMNLTPGKLRVPHTGIADAACLAEYGMLRGKP